MAPLWNENGHHAIPGMEYFFLFARSCIGIFADRGELALAITENRLQLDAPMSSWSVPTPPVQGEQHAEPVYHISDDSSSEGPP